MFGLIAGAALNWGGLDVTPEESDGAGGTTMIVAGETEAGSAGLKHAEG
jgi:hypothetical protein